MPSKKNGSVSDIPKETVISKSDLLAKIDYPVFCFKYLNTNVSMKKCNAELLRSFLIRMNDLSNMTWQQIAQSDRHQYGWEMIPKKQIKPKLSKEIVTDDVKEVFVFRYTKDKRPFVAIKEGKLLHVLLIEGNFGDVYNHGSK